MRKLLLSVLFFISIFSVHAQRSADLPKTEEDMVSLELMMDRLATRDFSHNFANSIAYTYVGSFNVNNGPYWQESPVVYTAQEAAALLFGGEPSDYATSTNSNTTNPATITHSAWASVYGYAGCQEVAEDFSFGYDGLYNDFGAVSSYVEDNCYMGGQTYVWRISQESSAFKTTWQTTASNESITIPTIGGGYDYTVNWGDGNEVSGYTGDATHTYDNPGIYTVIISGTFPQIYFNLGGDRMKIRSIEQWGNTAWRSMEAAFAGCENLVSNATDMPNVSSVTDMSGMFAYCRKYKGDAQMNNWDVSNVTNMYGMFGGASVFNHNIGGWNTANVTNMEVMFKGATIFNQSIGNWNTGSVTNMKEMFSTAFNFNQDLNWDVSNVTDMSGMFAYARKFNGNISNWNVGEVTNMHGMFGGASVFNSNIGNWDTAKVTNMTKMFDGATIFNQNIGNWNTGSVTNMKEMFRTALNFNQDLNAWNVSNVKNMSGMFAYARKFNGNVSSWNVSNVTDMFGMFGAASVFNSDISAWNVGKVKDMGNMFNGATVFNQDLSGWNVGRVTNMEKMFRTAMNFDSDISSWNVSNVTNMTELFAHANRFDQNLGNWNVSNVSKMDRMFHGIALSTVNYDGLLNGWSTRTLKSNVKFSCGNSSYCDGDMARQYIIDTFNWTITDGGSDCYVPLRPTGDSHIEITGSVSVYPNPMVNYVTISADQTFEKVSIYDLTGRLINTINLGDVENEIDVAHLKPATYLMVIDGPQGQVSKIVVKQ